MDSTDSRFTEFADKMRSAGLGDPEILAFRHSYGNLVDGQTGLLPEESIQPVTDLPRLEHIAGTPDPALLSHTAILKLNGGLGTSMGLETAKSLLLARDGLTFLEFFIQQVLFLRKQYELPLRFLLMNSFSTSRETISFLQRYPETGSRQDFELMQGQVPKVDAETLRPVSWPENPQLEWCPPGHGDLYPSMLGSGWLDRLLNEGVKILFVSNSDNLGANLDLQLLRYFADSDKPFLMEVAERTSSDRKGGHLAQRNGTLLLRESAQCPVADQPAFQDIQRHRFFNTNNLWIRLDHLKEFLASQGGFIPLPIIKNTKTVDPRRKDSPGVYQLETAMGAAIECFPNAGAILVPRARFAPVKTTADLLVLRSDVYEVTADRRVTPAETCKTLPVVDLDPPHYQHVDQFESLFPSAAPSLKHCGRLTVRGPVRFGPGTVFRGDVTVINRAPEPRTLPSGVHADGIVEL